MRCSRGTTTIDPNSKQLLRENSGLSKLSKVNFNHFRRTRWTMMFVILCIFSKTKTNRGQRTALMLYSFQFSALTDINVFSQHIFACPEPIPKITHSRARSTRFPVFTIANTTVCSLNTLVCCFWYFALNTQFVFTRHAYRVHMTESHPQNRRY